MWSLPFLQGQIYCHESSLWKTDLESVSPLHHQKPFALMQTHAQGPAGLLVPSDLHLPCLVVKKEAGSGRQTLWSLLQGEGRAAGGRSLVQHGKWTPCWGGPVTCIPGESPSQGSWGGGRGGGDLKSGGSAGKVVKENPEKRRWSG